MAFGAVQDINRSVLIARAKRPLLTWLQTLPEPTDTSLEEINRECTAYLVPEYDYETDVPDIIRDASQTVFEMELESWWRDQEDWPDTTDHALFLAWFDVEVHSVVHDLVPGPILFNDL